MSPQQQEWTAVINRLDKLEKQNHRMKRLAALALVSIGAILLLTCQRSPNRTIEAQELIIKDGSGRVRGRWTTDDNGPQLVLFAESRKPQASLGTEFGPFLVLYDTDGKARAKLAVNTLVGPILTFYSASGKGGRSRQTEFDRLLDQALGKAFGPKPAGTDGVVTDLSESGLAIFDEEGFETRIGRTDLATPRTGETYTTSAASIALLDKEKKVLWKAP